jgi:hypothetical protein
VLVLTRPLGQGRQLDAEEGVGVLDRLVTAPGRCSSGAARHAAQSGPLTALMEMANAPSWSPLPHASNAGPAGWRKASPLAQRWVRQDQLVHGLGMVECQLGGGRRAAGVAGDVGARHSPMVEDRRGVGGVAPDADR